MGVSAGGLDAFEQLLPVLPEDMGMALLLVQHLDRPHERLLSNLLASGTAMRVVHAEHGDQLRPNTIHVIRPDAGLKVHEGRIALGDAPPLPGTPLALDRLFRSLARALGPRAAGIVLSGAGSDGSAGLRDIKAAGGLTIAQAPSSCVHPGRPESAIAAGVVDLVLEVHDIPETLERFDRLSRVPPAEAQELDEPLAHASSLSEQDLGRLAALLQTERAFDLRVYKAGTVERRVRRRMALCGIAEAGAYLERLRGDGGEQRALVQDLLIGVTELFRDREAFEALREMVIEPLVAGAAAGSTLRAWVPACATGQEAYSVAIEFLEAIEAQEKDLSLQLFATDVTEEALTIGRAGLYPQSIAERMSPERLAAYFELSEGRGYKVRAALRETVSFAVHDLTRDPPFSRMDLVSCRNVLIYLRPAAQSSVLQALHFALGQGGCLFLGGSESPGLRRELFSTVSKERRIYRKIGTSRRFSGSGERVAALPRREGASGALAGRMAPRRAAAAGHEGRDFVRRAVMQALVPPTVVVSEEGAVLFAHGDLQPYLRFPQGEDPRLELASVIRQELATRTRVALYECRRDERPVITWASLAPGSPRRVRIKAVPGFELGEGCVILTFEDVEGPAPALAAAPQSPAEAVLIEQLEQELQATQADLRNTAEELETSNEELRSSNEELMSMNEELQASNEELETISAELRAANDESSSANAELREKVRELEAAHDDLENFFASTRLATIFLDDRLHLKRFTPAAMRLLHLEAEDVGRKIIRPGDAVLTRGLREQAEEVLESLAPTSEELQLRDGRWFVRDVLPYRTRARQVGGVVVAFSDVTEYKQAALGAAHLAAIVESSDDGILSLDLEGTVLTWNRGAERLFGYKAEEVCGQPIARFVTPGEAAHLPGHLAKLRSGAVIDSYDSERRRKDGSSICVALGLSPIVSHEGRVVGASMVARDISGQSRAREDSARLAAIIESSEDAILSHDFDGIITTWNRGAEQLYGHAAPAVIGKPIYLIVPGDCVQELRRAVDRVRQGTAVEPFETTRVHRDGHIIAVSCNLSPIRDHAGAVVAISAIDRDISERARARARVEESERQFRATFDNAAVGMAHVGLDGRFLHFNERLCALTGYARDELLARAFQDITHPGDVETEVAQARALAEGEIAHYQMEKRYVRKDGSMAWVQQTTSMVRDDRGDPDYYVAVVQDIEERKHLEEALEESGERMRVAAQVANVGTFEWRISSNENIWTPELEALYGIPPGGFGGRYESWIARVHPDDLPRAQAQVQEALRTGSFQGEWRAIWPDETVRWIEARGWVEKDGQGTPLRMIGVNLDITARKQAEAALRKLDELRRLALDSAQMGTWDLDVSTGTVTWDERGRALFGLSELALPREVSRSRIHPGDRAAVEEASAAAMDPAGDGAYDVEYRICPAEGETRWVRAVGQVSFEERDGVPRASRFVGVVMDTTQRKEAEAAIRKSEQRHRLAIEGAALGTWTYNPAREELHWDEHARAIVGLPADARIELSEALSIIHPEDRPAALSALEHVLQDGGRYYVEKRITPPGGSTRWVRTWGIAAKVGHDASAAQLIGVVQDITAQKQAEEALKEASRRKDDYLAMLSHELRNPLAAIRTAGEVIRHASDGVPALSRASGVLERQSSHMAKLLDGLLDVSRITRGKLTTDKKEVDLVPLLLYVLSDHAAAAEAKGVRLRADIDEGAVLALHADPARMTQVFDNLIGNAIKFTDWNGTVTVAAEAAAGEAVVAVRDTGIGFPPELSALLFEAFQQGPQDMARVAGGLGLGLALARGLVELHGGRIHAHSAGVGQGAAFVVTLPLSQSSAASKAAEQPANTGGNLHILLIEDNEDAAAMLRQVLELSGHEVDVATRGHQGVGIAREHRPDVVLCDIGLPGGMTGFDVARELRQDPETRDIRLVALTGYGRPEDKARCSEAGFDAHLTKPVDLDILSRMLQALRDEPAQPVTSR